MAEITRKTRDVRAAAIAALSCVALAAPAALATSSGESERLAQIERRIESALAEREAQREALGALDALAAQERTAADDHARALEEAASDFEAAAAAQATARLAWVERAADLARLDENAREQRRQVSENLAALAAGARASEPDPKLRSRLRALGGDLLSPWRDSERERAEAAEAHDLAAAAAREAEREVERLAALLARLDKRAEALQARRLDLTEKRAAAAALLAGVDGELETMRARRESEVAARDLSAVVEAAATPSELVARAALAAPALLESAERASVQVETALARPEPARAATANALLIEPPDVLPFGGEVVVGFGAADRGHRAEGVTIKASVESNKVTSIADGVVVFADQFKQYGMLLIIDHGEEYHSLLSGFSRLYVRKGDRVRRGQMVGELPMADDRAADLYVELRRSGEPVDPVPWLAPQIDKVRG